MGVQKKHTGTHSSETEARKDSHLELALNSQNQNIDNRFYYEPLLAAHPTKTEDWPIKIGDKSLRYPIWISSMTGGTSKTNEINKRLARSAHKFGLGMGIGSARIALEQREKIRDFDLRSTLGEEAPFYLNFGIAQIESHIQTNSLEAIRSLTDRLQADGIIIHVNPLQEWMQPEGDYISRTPIATIKDFLEKCDIPLIVKEVGQGFGYQSMKELLQLPLAAIEFAANGGTNFAKLELFRNKSKSEHLMPLVYIGHTADEMVDLSNSLANELGNKIKCPTIIISGGIKNFLDGYYYIKKSKINALYGQASEFLKRAKQSQKALDEYIRYQVEGLQLARTFLTLKTK